MYDQDREPNAVNPDGNDTAESIKGFERAMTRKENDRRAAVARAEAAEAELEAMRNRAVPVQEPYEPPEPIVDKNHPRWTPPPPPPQTDDQMRQQLLDAFEIEAPKIAARMRG